MVIHALESADPERAEELQSILKRDEPSSEDITGALEILQQAGSVEYSRQKAEGLAAEAREAIEQMPNDKPVSSVYTEKDLDLITPGNIEDHLDRLPTVAGLSDHVDPTLLEDVRDDAPHEMGVVGDDRTR
jgi:hypothetical protein